MAVRSRIALVTCDAAKLPHFYPTAAEPDFVPTEPPFTPDDQILVDELRRHGHEVAPIIWGCDTAPLVGSFDQLIIRSPWDYQDSPAQRQHFLAWIADLDRAGLVVENHPRIMAWLSDKRYLKDLEAVGAPIVPTRVVAPGEVVRLAEAFAASGPLILKPSVSAGGVGLVHVTSERAAEAFQPEFEAATKQERYLIQPFIPEIQSAGEWSLVYLGGEYSHAVHKSPGAGKILVQAEHGGSLRFTEPPSTVRAVGDDVMARLTQAVARWSEGTLTSPPLYMRIDLIESASGPMLSECEGVEPELFFRARPGSEQQFRRLLEARMEI